MYKTTIKDKLINYFSKFTTFTPDEINALTDSMVIKHFRKGCFMVKQGQYNTDSFFIVNGLVRQYKLIDGAEISTNFFTEGQWIISLTSFSDNNIATDYLICAEDTSVITGNEQKAQELFKKHPRFETISRAVIETAFAEQQKMMSSYLTDTPEQRYLKLLKTNPDIFQQIPQYHIASYIGVKPESLSRIRKRLLTKSKNLTQRS